MKTSNKLLFGFFGLVVTILIIANIGLKSEINNGNFKNNNIEQKTDSISSTKKSSQINLKF